MCLTITIFSSPFVDLLHLLMLFTSSSVILESVALKGNIIIRNNDKYIIGKIIKNTNIKDDPSDYIQVLDNESLEKYQKGCKGYIFETQPKHIDLTNINAIYFIFGDPRICCFSCLFR